MSDEQQACGRQEGEPQIWYARFTRYRLMEPTRSVAAVYATEQESKEENRGKQRKSEPSGYWYEIAKQWKWEERAQAWDAYQLAQEEKTIAQEKAQILKSRYALMHKRIEQLDRLVQKLIEYTDDENLVWLPDVKAIGNGPGAERVDLIQFNAPLFREIRGCFDDIASEMGERVKNTKTELTGKDGGSVKVDQSVLVYIPDNGRDPSEKGGGDA